MSIEFKIELAQIIYKHWGIGLPYLGDNLFDIWTPWKEMWIFHPVSSKSIKWLPQAYNNHTVYSHSYTQSWNYFYLPLSSLFQV